MILYQGYLKLNYVIYLAKNLRLYLDFLGYSLLKCKEFVQDRSLNSSV
ncbi:hypothetical protein SAMN06272755_0550 [Picosynechococcus sp. OG1]|nr:hypothetical protein SAMN06272755_0550 [Picosynechococcus sp. OG1]SMQ84565.1 hypothetical protein SAMN06272774_2924 [Synechococcus sp. 7002]